MRRFLFSPEDLEAIRHDRYHHPHPRVQQKMEVLWLKSQGLTHTAIAALAGVSRRSVQRYLDEYLDGGLEQVQRLSWKGKANELAEHQASLEAYRSTRPAPPAKPRLPSPNTPASTGAIVRAFLKNARPAPGARSAPSGQGRPRRTGRFPEDETPASSGPSPTRSTDCPVRGRGSLHLRAVPGLSVVPGAAARPRTLGPQALQCPGRAQRRDASGQLRLISLKNQSEFGAARPHPSPHASACPADYLSPWCPLQNRQCASRRSMPRFSGL